MVDSLLLLEEANVLDTEFGSSSDLFQFPTLKTMGLTEQNPNSDPDTKVNYLCGNSLGLMPVQTRKYLELELDAWAARGVESHFRNEITTDWVDVDLPLLPKLAKLVGAKESEVAAMGTLTMNLNSLLISFYKPQLNGKRKKILFEKGAFPSDFYALYNLAKIKGLDPQDTLIQISPRKGEYTLRNEDILSLIEKEGDEIALICFSGIQYYTGQFFNIKEITKKGHEKGCIVGWDLAHAVGNINLKLHDWDIDFAAWCSYKYLNSGPGAIGGIFVNEKHCNGNDESCLPRLAGWWGNNAEIRFQMLEKFNPIESALGFRQSNPSVLDISSLNSSLDVFQNCGGIDKLREKSIKLTSFLEKCLQQSKYYKTIKDSNKLNEDEIDKSSAHFLIITPVDEEQRGAQLSLLFKPNKLDVMVKIFKYMNERGTICDERRPNVIRLAPTPLYNTFTDCVKCVELLEEAFDVHFSENQKV